MISSRAISLGTVATWDEERFGPPILDFDYDPTWDECGEASDPSIQLWESIQEVVDNEITSSIIPVSEESSDSIWEDIQLSVDHELQSAEAALPFHYFSGMAERRTLPTTTRKRRTPAPAPPDPIKRSRLVSEVSINKATTKACCKANCIGALLPSLLKEVRQFYAHASESERTTQLLNFLRVGKDSGRYRYAYQYKGY